MEKMNKRFFSSKITLDYLLGAAAIVTGLCTLLGFLGGVWWVLELFSHFRVQYFVILLVVSIVHQIKRHKIRAMVTGVLVIVNFAFILPFYGGATSVDASARTLRAIQFNVKLENRNYVGFKKLVTSLNPDFFVLEEVDRQWIEEMKTLAGEYQVSVTRPGEYNSGIALFSKIPFQQGTTLDMGAADIPSVVAQFKIGKKTLTVIGIHFLPPLSRSLADTRKKQTVVLAHFVASQEGPVMVMGDMNMTSWSPHFKKLLTASGLKDSRVGFGIQPSWPTNFLPLLIPIDHALHSEGITIVDRSVGPHIGSDHYPVVIDFQID